jgi:hypothetical protein
MVVSYLADWLWQMSHNVIVLILLDLLLLTSLPFLNWTLYCQRDGFFAPLFCLLGIMLFDYISTNKFKRDPNSFSRIFGIIFVTTLVIITRFEAVIILPIVCFTLFIIEKKNLKQLCSYTAISIILIFPTLFVLYSMGKSGISGKIGLDGYTIISQESTLSFILARHDSYDSNPSETKKVIGDVFDIDALKQNADMTMLPLYFRSKINFTKQQGKDILRVTRRIYLENPRLWLQARTILFMRATFPGRWYPRYVDRYPLSQIHKLRMVPTKEVFHQNTFAKKIHNVMDWSCETRIPYPARGYLFWTFLPHLGLLLFSFLLWHICPASAVFSLIIVSRVFIVSITAGAPDFTYYLTAHYGGLFILPLCLAEYMYNKRYDMIQQNYNNVFFGITCTLVFYGLIISYFAFTYNWIPPILNN